MHEIGQPGSCSVGSRRRCSEGADTPVLQFAGHVMLNRMDRRSQLQCLGDCRELLQRGASVLFFPEGTRSKDGRMADFKKARLAVAWVTTGRVCSQEVCHHLFVSMTVEHRVNMQLCGQYFHS